ncbi:MAG: DUF1906 domain-containing protein, partial [Gammaproteobacteria bacterium]|nr:DUF1906 domain-containing protein [Gammaproteobacteria bacterium]NIW44422.1 DUF1906 domain-containing protein [Gammaproteobacteria bacterium]NIX55531.1 DUF1906 domain-containing protein [candidate division Zixibacteria bacterium]
YLEIHGTNDGGTTWNIKAEQLLSENEWTYPIISAIPGEIKILTQNQMITYWQTAELLQIEDRSGTENISHVEFSDTNHAWALAHTHHCEKPEDPKTCVSSTELLMTRDGGLRWLTLQIPQVSRLTVTEERSSTISPDGAQVLSRTSLHSGQGFDQCEISSLSDLQKWKTNSPYSVVNLYIGGKARACENVNLSPEFIEALSLQGWKFIPTWVGPQAYCSSFSVTMSGTPSTAYQQGKDQATDAARTARKYGLTYSDTDESGTVIYYDLEAFSIGTTPGCPNDPLTAAKAFINGWVEELHSKGIMAGLYGSACGSWLKEFNNIPNPPDVIWPAAWIADSYTSSITADNLPCITNVMWDNHRRIYQYTGAH